VNVNASQGSNPPLSSTQVPGASSVTIQQVVLSNPGTNVVTLNSLILSETGASTTGITSVELVDNGTVIATRSFSGTTPATFNLTSSNTIPPSNGAVTYQVVISFSNSAPTGSYAFSITGGTGSNGQPIGFNGLPVTGATITIALGTPTPTSTPNSTATSTPSFTPTFIVTTVVGPAYPNPATGPVSFTVLVPGPSTVNVTVFTAAFRKIYQSPVYQVTGSETLGWNLEDNWGHPVADGLYYVRIQVIGIQPTVKILKVLVIH
jgi:hypothetical protein